MCGIAGIVGDGAEQEKPLMATMLKMIAHRGPDDEGVWSFPGVLLGHRRLSILDLSKAGHQPMQSEDGRFTLTFNGEIYNYQELRAELVAHGLKFRTQTDTEVILMAWSIWGERCVERFNGMWAFALWDQERHLLFASRDRFGKKPFYYATHQGRFYFASEMKALLRIPGLGRTLNLGPLADFCIDRVICDADETLIREITALAPASTLAWQDGRLIQKSYWTFPDDAPPEPSPINRQRVDFLLEDAVRLRLRADTPVGCLVSGGLDSSVIAALMRKQAGDRPVHLFTTRTQPPVEELQGVDLLLKQGGYVPHWQTPDAKLFWNDLRDLVWHQETPFADGSMAAHFSLMREARRAGIPVLLTGQGADEVFAGYSTFLWRWLGSLWRHGQAAEALRETRAIAAHQPVSYAAIALHALPRRWREGLRRARAPSVDWLSADVRAARRPSDRWIDARSAPDELNAAQRLSIQRWTLPGFLHYEDRNAMAFGVETRLPYLDYRLVEALWALPPAERFSGGRTKAMLRDAARPWVPAAIHERMAKQGYPAPLAQWLRDLAPEIRGVMDSDAVRHCPFLNYASWSKKVDAFLIGRSIELEPVWRGLISALWYQRFFNETPA